MANGEEDLKEKNKDRFISGKSSKYSKWNSRFGHEDAEMLSEKSENWSASKSTRGDYDED